MTFKTFVDSIIAAISDSIVPLLLALVMLIFIWGLARYFILGGSDEAARAKGRQTALWGIFALVALVALWGIVNLLLSTLNITPGR